MKIDQLRYALAIYEMGSISKAAKALYLSQPNISNSVKNLEKELGFDILVRNTGGVYFTEKGEELIRHCQRIIDEIDGIGELAGREEELQFRLINPNYPPVLNAFIRLYNEFGKEKKYRFTINNAYQYESIQLLKENKINMAVTISYDIQSPSLLREIEKAGIEYVFLHNLSCTVNMSANHPLAKDPDFHLHKLKDYAFVDYSIHSDRGSPYNRISNISFVNLSKIIQVDSGEVRGKIISETDAYGISVQLPPQRIKELNYHCIPIPGLRMEIGYLRNKDHPLSKVEASFLKFLKEEITFLDDTAKA